MIEVASANRGQAWFVAATHRSRADPPLRLELWTMSQNNSDQLLRPRDAPALLMRVDSEAPKPDVTAIQSLRQQMATPGTESRRVRGVEASSPEQALEKIVAASKIVRDPAAQPQARVDALSELLAGVDDRILLEKLQLVELCDVLTTVPQSVYQQQAKGARRVVLIVGPEGARRRQEWTRTRTGWMLTGFEPHPDTP